MNSLEPIISRTRSKQKPKNDASAPTRLASRRAIRRSPSVDVAAVWNVDRISPYRSDLPSADGGRAVEWPSAHWNNKDRKIELVRVVSVSTSRLNLDFGLHISVEKPYIIFLCSIWTCPLIFWESKRPRIIIDYI